jgi:hypothetical protein
MPIVSHGVFGADNDSFPEDFCLLSVWGERLSDGFQLGRKGMWLLTLRLFMAGKGRGRIQIELQMEIDRDAGNCS